MSIMNSKKEKQDITIFNNMHDYSEGRFIIKKVERAIAFIAKHGLPKGDKPIQKIK